MVQQDLVVVFGLMIVNRMVMCLLERGPVDAEEACNRPRFEPECVARGREGSVVILGTPGLPSLPVLGTGMTGRALLHG